MGPEEWFRTQLFIDPKVGEEYLCITRSGSVYIVDIIASETGSGTIEYRVSSKSPKGSAAAGKIFTQFNESG